MIFFRIATLSLILIICSIQLASADSHDTQTNEEEEIPLNDPFAGNAATSATTGFNLPNNPEEEQDEMSLYNFKLVGIISGEYENYVSLVNSSGEVISLQLYDDLKEGLKLIDIRLTEAIFQKSDDTYMIINFKNQILEKDEY